MECKTIEIRDRATFIPALAIRLTADTGDQNRYLLRRAGYSLDGRDVFLCHLQTNSGTSDPFDWDGRTMQAAHSELCDNWDKYKAGDVLDVEFVAGEVTKPKVSERLSSGMGEAALEEAWIEMHGGG